MFFVFFRFYFFFGKKVYAKKKFTSTKRDVCFTKQTAFALKNLLLAKDQVFQTVFHFQMHSRGSSRSFGFQCMHQFLLRNPHWDVVWIMFFTEVLKWEKKNQKWNLPNTYLIAFYELKLNITMDKKNATPLQNTKKLSLKYQTAFKTLFQCFFRFMLCITSL